MKILVLILCVQNLLVLTVCQYLLGGCVICLLRLSGSSGFTRQGGRTCHSQGRSCFSSSSGPILCFRASDVYAFGTVWYELLTGEWPWKQQPPEAIIWQVGRGIKPTLANLQASREVKDILVQCWLFNAKERPEFPDIAQTLERLPKKRLARSPSHPIHLSRSAESVF